MGHGNSQVGELDLGQVTAAIRASWLGTSGLTAMMPAPASAMLVL
jgi:hypothetical protein